MSALLEGSQTSSDNWNVQPPMMLLARQQETGQIPTPDMQLAILNEFEAQMASHELENEAVLREVFRLYVFQLDSSEAKFLKDYRVVSQALIAAFPHLQRHFGSDTVFTLLASTDENGWQTLYAIARWSGRASEAVEALDQFQDAWWVANSRSAGGSLNFTYELV